MKIPHITIRLKNIFIVPETTDLGKVAADLRELGNKVGETFLKLHEIILQNLNQILQTQSTV